MVDRKIVIGDDETTDGEDALALGRTLAEAVEAEPVVVSVVEFPSTMANLLNVDDYLGSTSGDLRRRVDYALGRPGSDVRSSVSESPARILDEIAEQDAALAIVVGSSRRGALGRIYPGSTALALLHGAPCAMAIAPRGYGAQARTLERIAIAFDGSDESTAALYAAISLARRVSARLSILAVARPFPEIMPPQVGAPGIEAFVEAERDAKRSLLEEALERAGDGVDVEGALLEGEPAQELADVSGGFDLLLAGSRGYGPLGRVLLGTITAPLSRSTLCPLLIFPRHAGDDPLRLSELEAAERTAPGS